MDIDILVEEGAGKCPGESWLREVARHVLTIEGAVTNAELGLALTGQERVRQLNKEFRGKDKPTDVLAFSNADGGPFVVAPDGALHLGEVVISCPQAGIQSKERGHSLEREIAVLMIHGILHLFGYDHLKPEMRQAMRERESEILSRIEQAGLVSGS